MINVLFAVNQDTYEKLRDNFRRDEDGNRLRTDLTDAQAKKLRTSIHSHWKTPTLGGTVYHVASWYVPEIYGDGSRDAVITDGLKWVEFLTNKWPSKFHILGAWNKDGSQFGTTITQVENGTDLVDEYQTVEVPYTVQVLDVEATIAADSPVYKDETRYRKEQQPTGQQIEAPHFDEAVVGTPVYPIHAQILKIMPDDVTYDANGNETSRVPASAPKEVNKMVGWKDRRWS